ncbi:MAG: flavin reductase [Anaerolineae bacterium]|nr:MAG: flavin reductase [Anaerolineae bacterium]
MEANELREAMRFWATGVTIVSARHNDIQHGMTVTSFTSLSLEPPLVMVSLEKTTRTHGLVDLSGAFGVSMLREDQRPVSNRFAGLATELTNRFAGLKTFTLETGSPLLENGLAWLDCRVTERHAAGTHTIFFGEVIATRASEGAPPLLYFNRDYRGMQDSRDR